MIDIESTQISAEEIELLKHPQVGAVLLFSRNFHNSDQLKDLVFTIHQTNSELFIAVDHEGGYVQRFQRHGFRALPAARIYGDTYDLNPDAGLELARNYGRVMAQDLINCGIHLSLSPVLDLHGNCPVIGQLDRAFHADPNVLTQLAEAFIAGMNSVGMPAIGKHYPGHGSVLLDSHIDKPICDVSWEQLCNEDMLPFLTLIQKNALAAIMPAYVTYSQIDPTQPAGYSSIWLNKILRQQQGFTGLILSDCLSMRGADAGDLLLRAELAVRAGCDMLIVSHQPRNVLYKLIDDTSIQQNDESVDRIVLFRNLLPKLTPVSIHEKVRVNQNLEDKLACNDVNRTLQV